MPRSNRVVVQGLGGTVLPSGGPPSLQSEPVAPRRFVQPTAKSIGTDIARNEMTRSPPVLSIGTQMHDLVAAATTRST